MDFFLDRSFSRKLESDTIPGENKRDWLPGFGGLRDPLVNGSHPTGTYGTSVWHFASVKTCHHEKITIPASKPVDIQSSLQCLRCQTLLRRARTSTRNSSLGDSVGERKSENVMAKSNVSDFFDVSPHPTRNGIVQKQK